LILVEPGRLDASLDKRVALEIGGLSAIRFRDAHIPNQHRFLPSSFLGYPRPEKAQENSRTYAPNFCHSTSAGPSSPSSASRSASRIRRPDWLHIHGPCSPTPPRASIRSIQTTARLLSRPAAR